MRISDWSSDVCSSDLAAQPDLRLLLAVRRELDDEIVDTRRVEVREAGKSGVHYLMRQHVDGAVGGHVEVMVGVAEIFPDDVGVAVHLDQAVAPGRIKSDQRRVGKECGGKWRYR